MRPEDRQRASLNFGLIYESLLTAMNQAGGIPRSMDGLINMSAFDLLCELGANSIYFSFTPATGGPPKERIDPYRLKKVGADDDR